MQGNLVGRREHGDVSLKLGLGWCWEGGLRKEGEATGNLARPKEEPGHMFGFPLHPT